MLQGYRTQEILGILCGKWQTSWGTFIVRKEKLTSDMVEVSNKKVLMCHSKK